AEGQLHSRQHRAGGAAFPLRIPGADPLLYAHGRRTSNPRNRAVNDLEGRAALVEADLEIDVAARVAQVGAPFDIEDPVRRAAAHRSEYAAPGAVRKEVVPVRHDGVGEVGLGQAAIHVVRVRAEELQVAVRAGRGRAAPGKAIEVEGKR